MILDSKEQKELLINLISNVNLNVRVKDLLNVSEKVVKLLNDINNAEIKKQDKSTK